MLHIFSTSQSSTLVLMGWDLEDTSISDLVHNGSCGVGDWLLHIFSTSKRSILVLRGLESDNTSIFHTLSTMVHVGWVAG